MNEMVGLVVISNLTSDKIELNLKINLKYMMWYLVRIGKYNIKQNLNVGVHICIISRRKNIKIKI